MSNFRPIEMRLLDDLFGMASGNALDFSNRTFAEFFAREFNINIDDPQFALSLAGPKIQAQDLLL